jgi:hypothetical protein
LIPVQGTTGWGSFHLSSPTGAAANGMPLYIETSPSSDEVPIILPPSTVIGLFGFVMTTLEVEFEAKA